MRLNAKITILAVASCGMIMYGIVAATGNEETYETENNNSIEAEHYPDYTVTKITEEEQLLLSETEAIIRDSSERTKEKVKPKVKRKSKKLKAKEINSKMFMRGEPYWEPRFSEDFDSGTDTIMAVQ
ncbi:MAG: hypothetical protein ACK40G_07650 [Cytophagaceae bacterium]